MAGGIDAAIQVGTRDVAKYIPGAGIAVDLGTGFGTHSIPLAGAGYEVLAVDTSALLLSTLRENSKGLPIRVVASDPLQFHRYMSIPANLIICMGDTLTHLECVEQVVRLSHEVRRSLVPGGKFVATFRDYSNLPSGEARFIPVRSDSDRILACFLEESPEHVIVHDLLHAALPRQAWRQESRRVREGWFSSQLMPSVFEVADVSGLPSGKSRGRGICCRFPG